MSDTLLDDNDNTLRQLIEIRAYELWENDGRPDGQDVIHWCIAERELLGAAENPGDTTPDLVLIEAIAAE